MFSSFSFCTFILILLPFEGFEFSVFFSVDDEDVDDEDVDDGDVDVDGDVDIGGDVVVGLDALDWSEERKLGGKCKFRLVMVEERRTSWFSFLLNFWCFFFSSFPLSSNSFL